MDRADLPPYDQDPTTGRVPATQRMPYGWKSPRMGRRGWAGAIIIVIALTVLTTVDWPWWGNLLAWMFIWAVPVELLRTDAIQRHGAVVFEYIRNYEDINDLYWGNDA